MDQKLLFMFLFYLCVKICGIIYLTQVKMDRKSTTKENSKTHDIKRFV